ncbi:MAG: ParB/RepB/Spo0J family partition protein [Cetobacterium sp.]
MLNNNHLNNLGDIKRVTLQKTIISKYSDFQNITESLIKNIDYSNKKFINRLNDTETIINDAEFLSLFESIKEIGLINPVYLLEVDKNTYVIVSGWRRLLALKQIYELNQNRIFSQKAIVFRKDTPLEILENISIDENTQRKNLTLLELSYKFNNLAKADGVSIEDCLTKFKIGKTQFHAIKKAIDFESFIKESILEEAGPLKSDYLNRIFIKLLEKNNEEDSKEILKTYLENSIDDLKIIYKKLTDQSLKTNNKIFEYKLNKKGATFKISEKLTEEDCTKIENFIKKLLKK